MDILALKSDPIYITGPVCQHVTETDKLMKLDVIISPKLSDVIFTRQIRGFGEIENAEKIVESLIW